ncbi:Aspartate/methionine/tyrosine aminotransferase [Desulfatibacillum alkenivorans DSM 16219]|uniref:Aminotransferase n=1 Tax=Desulfatibacillum alkenivorans DSM 16219 TaxID=1121393 RepID=A0A1M6L416_9BACT|nr:pyridoxal phosphate-dependent aminotransferase [Desulfatibacillum alkenivorans]SHJ65936.1 Aspartate/methionine/tyrosine aminotransferase [Desulfatibacillum alkenivorans DSM 16219]
MTVSKRVDQITPFIVMEVLERAKAMERQGVNIVHLEVGEPDFDTPECITEAGIKALRDGHSHYTHSLGILELREAIAEHYYNEYGVEVNPDHIVVTNGTSPGIFMTFAALLEAGDEVIVSDPHYACYPNFIEFAGAKPVKVAVTEEEGFQYRAEEIQKHMTGRTKAVMINSPSNPTGNLLSPERMQQVADLGKMVVSDEIYHGLVYEGKERSILEFTDEAFVLNGFSKAHAMTGWRLGYLIAPKRFIRPLQKLQQNFFISANAMTQMAGIAALKEAGPDVARMREIYDQRRRFMIRRLREIGLGITVEPTGAFYVLANARHLGSDSYKMAFDILENAHVGVTPGIDFGQQAEGYIRFSYANSLENIEEGMNRLEKYINSL